MDEYSSYKVIPEIYTARFAIGDQVVVNDNCDELPAQNESGIVCRAEWVWQHDQSYLYIYWVYVAALDTVYHCAEWEIDSRWH